MIHLMSEQNLEIKINPVPQSEGGVKYSISMRLNPKTIRVMPGGSFHDNTVISGELIQGSEEAEAKEIFGLFRKEIRRQFRKHKSYPYWIGKEADKMHSLGARLTNDVKSLVSLPYQP